MKWSPGRRRSRTRAEYSTLLEWYNLSNPNIREYGKMWELWKLWNPTYRLTLKQLWTQCSNICKRSLLSHQETDEVQQHFNGKEEPRRRISKETPSFPTSEYVPSSIEKPCWDEYLRLKIITQIDIYCMTCIVTKAKWLRTHWRSTRRYQFNTTRYLLWSQNQ